MSYCFNIKRNSASQHWIENSVGRAVAAKYYERYSEEPSWHYQRVHRNVGLESEYARAVRTNLSCRFFSTSKA